jgi:predicted SnoaL-like aldol condensation-catalyzing enzyme
MDRKQMAQTFLQWCATGRVKEAYDAFVATDFKHHNAFYPGDAQSLMRGMEDAAKQDPTKQLDVQRVIEDGDLVAVHSHLTQRDARAKDLAVVHILRFAGDRIAEFWDVAQLIPPSSPNANGMF